MGLIAKFRILTKAWITARVRFLLKITLVVVRKNVKQTRRRTRAAIITGIVHYLRALSGQSAPILTVEWITCTPASIPTNFSSTVRWWGQVERRSHDKWDVNPPRQSSGHYFNCLPAFQRAQQIMLLVFSLMKFNSVCVCTWGFCKLFVNSYFCTWYRIDPDSSNNKKNLWTPRKRMHKRHQHMIHGTKHGANMS